MTKEDFKDSIKVFLTINDQKAISRMCEYNTEKTIACFDEFNRVKNDQKTLNELIDRIYNDVTDRFKYFVDDNDVKIYSIKRKSIK